jgi:Zn-dependent membrane protease YugP
VTNVFFIDPLYIAILLPGLLLSLLATFMTRSTFAKYSKIAAYSRMTGAQAAKRLLDCAGIYDVGIEPVSGFLSDHYDPSSKTLRLSPDVYRSNSLSAIGVACHEAGHAIQHAQGYAPLALRSAMVPVTSVSSNLSYWIILAGFILSSKPLLLAGIVLFSAAVVFSIVTLPVEWDASARAKRLMVDAGIVSIQEAGDSARVLNAAFMTYVAAAVSALLTLLYYILRANQSR